MNELPHFVVVDVETTGLNPHGNDRILEFAAVRVDFNGDILSEYCTLVNPERDVGPTHIHGLTARDVRHAPAFAEIVGDVLSVISGAVFTAHNVLFDKRFVETELARARCTIPPFPLLCTMRLAKIAEPALPSRALLAVCDFLGLPIQHQHSALADARAAAAIVRIGLERVRKRLGRQLQPSDIGVRGPFPPPKSFPAIRPSGVALTRRAARRKRLAQPSFIAQLVSRLPAHLASSEASDEYLCLLDRVLWDRRVTPDEFHLLLAFARDAGLSAPGALACHRAYLRDLVVTALEDGVITHAEARDLNEVRQLLGIAEEEYRVIEREARSDRSHGGHDATSSRGAADITGKTVCFSGELSCRIAGVRVTRDRAEMLARDRGLEVQCRVTKKLDFLVVADPYSQSRKAQAARRYGIPVLAEPVFFSMLGIQVE